MSLQEKLDEFDILREFAESDEDSASGEEAVALFGDIRESLEKTEQQALLSGETDPNNAIISINAGAGGTESCDWAMMLHRMLVRYAEDLKFKVELIDFQDGDAAGIKSSTILVQGPFAYGLLKSEVGIHRLVRISPFDSNARRHTSFASVFVSAEVDDEIDIQVDEKDYKIDVFRSSGAGGQHVNTTDSAVRLTHFPTGIQIVCRNERSQIQNRAMAMKILKSRLFDLEIQKRQDAQDAVEAGKKKIEWGSQIRSYVLHPYKLVKDHRTGFEVSTAEKVLDGDLNGFTRAYLQWFLTGEKVEKD